MVRDLQFLSVCNRGSYLIWLQKSKQRLGFFESPYLLCWILNNSHVAFIYPMLTIQVIRPLGRC